MKRLIFLLIPVFLILMSCSPKKSDTRQNSIAVTGKIIAMDGEIEVDGKSAELGAVINDGAVIKSESGSYCEIQFLGSNVIRVYEDTIIRLSFSEANIRIDKGAVAAVLRNIGSLIQTMDDLFEVNSGSVVAGIRGTSFFVKRESADQSYFCLCNGEIELRDPTGAVDQGLSSSHHAAYRIKENGNQTIFSKAPLLYHDDSTMEALAASIGLKMDWSEVESYY